MIEQERRTGRRTPKEPLILDTARTIFLQHGFGSASVDEIARRAAISKVTLYKYFPSKELLFTAVIRRDIESAARLSDSHVEALSTTTDLEGDLRAFAREFATTVTDPDLLRLRRLVATEAERFPELARAWDERSRQQGLHTLTTLLQSLADRGLLTGDMDVAAEQFLWLLLGAPLNAALFDPSVPPSEERDLRDHADAAIRTFLAAYGTGEPRQHPA